MALAGAPRTPREQAAPGGVREVAVGRVAVAEVEAWSGAGASPGDAARELADGALGVRRECRPRDFGRLARARRARAPDGPFGKLRHHVRAGAAPRLRIALGHELLVGLEHGVARELRLGREHAARGQPFAGRKAPVEDRGAQRTVGLAVERSVAVEREPHSSDPGPPRLAPEIYRIVALSRNRSSKAL